MREIAKGTDDGNDPLSMSGPFDASENVLDPETGNIKGPEAEKGKVKMNWVTVAVRVIETPSTEAQSREMYSEMQQVLCKK